MFLLIKNGQLIDPSNQVNDRMDILVQDGVIKEIATNIVVEDVRVIDASNKIIVPGLIDSHVHFRQPGQMHKETIKTGSRAAAKGGWTTVIAEPNTIPPVDTPFRVKNVLKIAKQESIVNFYTKACITKEGKGERLTDVKGLRDAGAVAISDDGNPVFGKRLMFNAFKKARECNIQVSPHCEESEYYHQRLLKKFGQQELSFLAYNKEVFFIRREIELVQRSGGSVHISHISQAESVEEIARAKERGIKVTSEVTPHHFTLTQEATIKNTNTNAKVNPPLRLNRDVEAVKRGLKDGIIDVIATDHAPHTSYEKDVQWDEAPFGVIGLETGLGLVLTELVQTGVLSLPDAIAKMTINPARIFGLNAGELKIGSPADITIIDLNKEWVVNVDEFESKGRNCPFNGWRLKGKTDTTIVKGNIVYHLLLL